MAANTLRDYMVNVASLTTPCRRRKKRTSGDAGVSTRVTACHIVFLSPMIAPDVHNLRMINEYRAMRHGHA